MGFESFPQPDSSPLEQKSELEILQNEVEALRLELDVLLEEKKAATPRAGIDQEIKQAWDTFADKNQRLKRLLEVDPAS